LLVGGSSFAARDRFKFADNLAIATSGAVPFRFECYSFGPNHSTLILISCAACAITLSAVASIFAEIS